MNYKVPLKLNLQGTRTRFRFLSFLPSMISMASIVSTASRVSRASRLLVFLGFRAGSMNSHILAIKEGRASRFRV